MTNFLAEMTNFYILTEEFGHEHHSVFTVYTLHRYICIKACGYVCIAATKINRKTVKAYSTHMI